MSSNPIVSAVLLASFLVISEGKTVPGQLQRSGHPGLHRRLETLIIGGGPDKDYNQAGIESNVRYVDKLLPADSSRRVLFADGNRRSKSVFCEGLFKDYFREPNLARIDGPSTNAGVKRELSSMSKDLAGKPGTPALIYFTGHGGGDREGEYQDNYYCTWKDDQFPVTDLASALAPFPKSSPIVLVMAECYSGGFGNLLFQDGQPDSPMVDRPICGFFASTAQRMSAGCTPDVNEADYKDFSGYFFAALTGVDRMGKPVNGADYDHDGKVTMDEAFAFTLIHDDSIDTPVCTSDVFLRRYVKKPDKDCFKARYSDALVWATPSQRAALLALHDYLGLSDDGDMLEAFREFERSDASAMDSRTVHLFRFCRLYKTIALTHELKTASDLGLKLRFKSLIEQEHSNPLVDAPSVLLGSR